MNWFIHISSLKGIVMHVIQLLTHHGIMLNLFGMAVLLPNLISAVCLMASSVPMQLIQDQVAWRASRKSMMLRAV